jgi:hypothetical protein
MSPWWTLAPVSLAAGALMMWAFRRMADLDGIVRAANRIQAHLLEFWIFVDEPASVWKSWRGLLSANGRFLRLLLAPLAILSIPMAPLFFGLDALYGSTPLRVGEPALVTAGVDRALDAMPTPVLEVPDGMSVDGPPVRVFSEREVTWRVRPARELSGRLECDIAGERAAKSVAAGEGCRFLSRKRTGSLLELVRYPAERPLGAGPVRWIEVAYPPASVPLFGMSAHWSIWFFALSVVGAILAPK